MKKVLKAIVTKIPLFLFCVLFISGYGVLFGKENSTIGVALLTTLLVFLKNDFGYNAKEASITLGGLLLVMIVGPKLSLMNPFLGIVVNLAAIMTILVLSSYDVEQDNHVPFLLGYIFSQGYNVTGPLFTKRVLSIVIGALLVGGIYFLRTRKESYEVGLKDVIKSVDIHKPNTQWYLKLAITLTVVMFLGDIFNYSRTIWISFAVLSLTYHQHEERERRIKHRLPATIIGSIAFFILFEYIIPQEIQGMVAALTGFIMMFINSYFRKTMANSFNALLSAMMMGAGGGAVVLRILSNVVGVGIVMLSHRLFDSFFERLAKRKLESA